jgi:methylmalonyl-CoA mutase
MKFQDEIKLLEIDNELVCKNQMNKIKKLKKNRNNDEVKKILNEIELCAKNNNKNLLALAIKAAKKRATLGEISFAIEKVYGRYQPKIKSISGVYKSKMKKNKLFKKAVQLSDNFSENQGRRPRILIAKVGQDGHDRGAKVIASSFADMGFDVDIGPLFQSPNDVVKQAIENDVHIIGVSSLAGGHKTLTKELYLDLNEYHSNEIMVVIGGIIPKADHQFLKNLGVSAIFGPGSNINEIAVKLLNLLLQKK